MPFSAALSRVTLASVILQNIRNSIGTSASVNMIFNSLSLANRFFVSSCFLEFCRSMDKNILIDVLLSSVISS